MLAFLWPGPPWLASLAIALPGYSWLPLPSPGSGSSRLVLASCGMALPDSCSSWLFLWPGPSCGLSLPGSRFLALPMAWPFLAPQASTMASRCVAKAEASVTPDIIQLFCPQTLWMSAAWKSTLKLLLSWQCCDSGFKGTGKTLNT